MATAVPDSPDAATQPIAVVPIPRPGGDPPRTAPRHAVAPAPAAPAPGTAPPGRRRTGRGTVFRGAARTVFVTPWFAAATGFVIAAGLWAYSPHTVLRFPNSAPGVSVCKSTGCVPESDPQGGSLAVVAPGVKINDSQGARRTGHANNAARGLKFKFTVLWSRQNGFGAEVTVSGHKVPSSWRLSFDLPGAQIADVEGVAWQPAADGSGGTASALSSQSRGDPGDGGFGGSGSYGGFELNTGPAVGPTRPGPVITFLITASGPQVKPVRCVFDHATCTFR